MKSTHAVIVVSVVVVIACGGGGAGGGGTGGSGAMVGTGPVTVADVPTAAEFKKTIEQSVVRDHQMSPSRAAVWFRI